MSKTEHPPTPLVHRKACYIRLSDSQYDQIKRDSLKCGKSVPDLMKEAYFQGESLTILMADSDKHYLFTQIQRMGNNINQIAKKVNAGFAFGFEQDLEFVRSGITAITAWLTARYKSNRRADQQ